MVLHVGRQPALPDIYAVLFRSSRPWGLQCRCICSCVHRGHLVRHKSVHAVSIYLTPGVVAVVQHVER